MTQNLRLFKTFAEISEEVETQVVADSIFPF